ncbi:MAG: O-succinylhomoserine sulfhydrylase [Rhodobacteraceae bacterium]|nr:O-succinylhomoserine sulfhydrylase [Paracoccaceae bacterium]
MNPDEYSGWQTKAVHAGTRRSQYGEMSEAIFMTQGFSYESAEQAESRFIECGEDEFIYARYGNPTVRMFEERMAALEGVEDGFATGSGMAAVHGTLCALLSSGDRLVSSRALFGSCLFIVESVLPRFGVEVELVDGTDAAQWQSAIRPGTKAVFLETVSNPMLEVIDLRHVADLTRRVGATLIVDNALATPVFQRTGDLGADIVIYSTTKHVDGQGRCLGGIVLGEQEFIRRIFEPFVKHTGGAISPFNAWIMLKGLETMSLRCHRQADTALQLAECAESHANVAKVRYPHLPSHPQQRLATGQMQKGGTVLTLEVNGGRDAAFRFINALSLFQISNNFADAKSIVTHPATTTHQRLTVEQRLHLGITDGVVRISAGLEDPADLLVDLSRALDAV